MTNIYKFPNKMKTLRAKIHEGLITDEIRDYLLKELDYLKENHPNSWDKKFSESILLKRNKLSPKQIEQLERILQNPILDEEYPNGIEL